ncbi:MAG: FKBP-type peptidyl-prolyl cis-trans isomerase [Planctomycetaceae bacterium]|nr:FKBP-type peptidyl-prolyl cis-trans isomerase [Planctomycetales bacterium]MCB9924111.1 FKBP-type peptidyl-prolyl cis-trans isomerase [Planctomycetaceae bacterium]
MQFSIRRELTALLCVFSVFACSCSSTTTSKPHFGENAASASATAGPVDADAPTEFTSTESGLKYRVLRKSEGTKPVASDTVLAHYVGWLDDGSEFDSSYSRGEPTSFPLSGVIPGWTEGLQLVGEGGMIELEIPSDLGYGEMGMPGAIPPRATLHFKVELIDIF